MTARSVAVAEETHVAEARRGAVEAATRSGFGEEDRARVALVATELATNLLKHGGGGELLVSLFEDRTGEGVECLAIDGGPGMANVDASLRDGHSTAGTAGDGLGAIVRGAHVVDIYSRPAAGTVVVARMQKGRPSRAAAGPTALSGVVSLPKPGEEAQGDAWCVRSRQGGVSVVVADGLGHGPVAAKASVAAIEVFLSDPHRPPAEILDRMGPALQPTRGAAVAVADLDLRRGSVVFAGIGNIAGVAISEGSVRRMISHNGTVGMTAKRAQPFSYPFETPPLLILCSDGLQTSWSLDRYPGLAERHPSVIAGVLYRDYNRGRDDVTVLVVRGDQI